MRGIWAVILLFAPGLADAEALQIKAADHDAFSRIVFYGQTANDWAVLKTSEGYLLRQPNAEFDTSQVFQRMSKTRVSDLIATDDGVFLNVACDCNANAFFLAPDMVVIDINDGSGTDLGLARAALTPKQRAGLQAALAKPKAKVQPVDLQQLEKDNELSEAISIAEALLIEQLGRAASQGLASPREQTVPVDPQRITPMTPRVPSIESDVLTTSSTIDFVDPEAEEAERHAAECLSENWLPSREWSRTGVFTDGLAELRTELADPTDAISPARQLALARHYLAHGFTLEAVDIVADNTSQEADTLRHLALLIDQSDNPTRWLSVPDDCPGTSAIWQILSSPTDQVSDETKQNALQALPRLPLDLARIVVPRLIEIAYLAEQPKLAADFASQLRYLIGPDAQTLSNTLPVASLAASSEQVKLLELARSSNPESSEALVAYVALQFGEQKPLPADIPNLIDAYAFESKGTPLGADLERARIMASGLAGDFGALFGSLQNKQEDIELLTGAFALLAKNSSDIQFLRHSAQEVPALNANLHLKIAERMMTLGFFDLAHIWLPNDMTPETRLMRARVFLESDRFEDALTELSGQLSRPATMLRAKVRLRQRAYSDAARIFADIDMNAPALRAAFLANEPELIAQNWVAEQAESFLVPLPEPAEDDPSLSADQHLIEVTQQKSAAIKDALATFATP